MIEVVVPTVCGLVSTATLVFAGCSDYPGVGGNAAGGSVGGEEQDGGTGGAGGAPESCECARAADCFFCDAPTEPGGPSFRELDPTSISCEADGRCGGLYQDSGCYDDGDCYATASAPYCEALGCWGEPCWLRCRERDDCYVCGWRFGLGLGPAAGATRWIDCVDYDCQVVCSECTTDADCAASGPCGHYGCHCASGAGGGP